MIDKTLEGWAPNPATVPSVPSGEQGPDRTSGNAPEREELHPPEQK
jgi:hypothetical protein